MKFEKKLLTPLHRCYATSSVTIDGQPRVLLATEGEGACYLYSGEDFRQTTVWDGPGGTVSIAEVPGTNGEFLAVQNFFPTFQSEHATIVWAKHDDQLNWTIHPFLDLPYVHRFGILRGEDGTLYLLAATLCTSKQFKDDWSDPGKLYVGELPDHPEDSMELTVIKDGLTKNHGFCQTVWEGREVGLVTSQEGVFLVTPPARRGGSWTVKQLMDRPTSDVAACDIDGDGELELLTFAPFHGGDISLFKKRDGTYDRYEKVWTYDNGVEFEFAHAIWGGMLRGVPAFLCGIRRGLKELFVLTYDRETGSYRTEIIDQGGGPSNVAVVNGSDRDILICADREVGNAVVYLVTD